MKRLLTYFKAAALCLAFALPFTGNSQDVGVSAILSPVSGCGSSSQTIKVIVKNFGLTSQSNLIVKANAVYGVNNLTWTDTLKKTLAAGAQDTLKFRNVGWVTSTVTTTIKFKAYTTLSGDLLHSNDTTYNNSLLFKAGPSAYLSAGPTAFCQGKTVVFNPAPSASQTTKTNVATSFATGDITWYFGTGNKYVPSITSSTTYTVKQTYYYSTPGTYKAWLAVKNANGCYDTAYQTITVYPNYTKGVTLIQGKPFQGSYNNGTIGDPDRVCSDDTLRYQLTPPTGFSNSDYGTKWTILSYDFRNTTGYITTDTAVNKVTSSSNWQFTYFPKSKTSNDTFILTITVRGISNPNCDTVIQRYILVGAKPVPYFGYANLVCYTSPMQFIDSSKVNGPSDYVYNFGDPNSGINNTSTSHNPSHQFTAPGTYNVSLSITSLAGCTVKYTRQITVYGPPKVRFGAITSCRNNPASFIDSTGYYSGQTVQTYAWDFGDPTSGSLNTSTKAAPTHIYTKAGTYTVKLTVTMTTGCSASGTISITVQDKPVAGFSFTNSCVTDYLTFTNSSTDPAGKGLTYQWNFGDGQTLQTKDATHHYFNSGNYRVKLTVTTPSGCYDTISKIVTAYQVPKMKVIVVSACEGQPVTLYDSSYVTAAGVSINKHIWDFQDQTPRQTTVVPTVTHQFPASGSYFIWVTAITSQGCMDSAFVQVDVTAKPSAAFSLSSGCPDKPVTFTDNSSANGGGTLTYAWDFGDAQTSTIQNPTHSYASAGTYRVKLKITNASGCTDTTSRKVTLNALPTPDFTWKVTLSSSTKKKIQMDINDPTTYSSITWDFGDGSATATGPSQIHTFNYTTGQKYHICITAVTSSGGCTVKNCIDVDPTQVGIAPMIAEENGIKVFPNPFDNATNISYSLDARSNVSVRVFDLAGKELATLVNEKQNEGEHTVVFNAGRNNIQPGVYILKVMIDENTYTTRIVNLK